MGASKPTRNNIIQELMRPIRRRRFVESVRPSDVFLVTYPKSGTTWVGFLLANLIHGKQEPPLNLRTYLKYIPDINNSYFDGSNLSCYSDMPDPRFFSTHAPYEPAFSKVIYVIRDPRDVLVSYWHHTKVMKPWFKLTIDEYIVNGQHWPNSWHEHVAGWVLGGHRNVFVVRYEDLKKGPVDTVKKMLDFVDFPYDEELIMHAVNTSRFEKMKSLEEKYGSGQHNDSLKGFIRQGKTGSWRDEISHETLVALEKKFGFVMKAVGYELTTEQST
ncbi:MAG: sulfotransferase domain-containing protein [Chloroflexota bacterium]